VWECEFKNIRNVGRIWLKFKEEDKPFGIPLRDKRTHSKISSGDIIQIDRAYYMVNSVSARKVRLVDLVSFTCNELLRWLHIGVNIETNYSNVPYPNSWKAKAG
jgi:hypothetical protein